MAQGTMVVANLFHDNVQGDIFTEVDHGPFTFANNLFLSNPALPINAAGGAYVHNLVAGAVVNQGPDSRDTPVLLQHETDIVAVVVATDGDARLYNNIVAAPGSFKSFDPDVMPCYGRGNVYTGAGSGPSKYETSSLVNASFVVGAQLSTVNGVWYLQATFDPRWAPEQPRPLVTTVLLGNASVPKQAYTYPDNSSISITQDYFGHPRNTSNPFPGPLEIGTAGTFQVQVWPKPVTATASGASMKSG
jgi:hypothetical protein